MTFSISYVLKLRLYIRKLSDLSKIVSWLHSALVSTEMLILDLASLVTAFYSSKCAGLSIPRNGNFHLCQDGLESGFFIISSLDQNELPNLGVFYWVGYCGKSVAAYF